MPQNNNNQWDPNDPNNPANQQNQNDPAGAPPADPRDPGGMPSTTADPRDPGGMPSTTADPPPARVPTDPGPAVEDPREPGGVTPPGGYDPGGALAGQHTTEDWEQYGEGYEEQAGNAWEDLQGWWGDMNAQTGQQFDDLSTQNEQMWEDLYGQNQEMWGDLQDQTAGQWDEAIGQNQQMWGDLTEQNQGQWSDLQEQSGQRFEDLQGEFGDYEARQNQLWQDVMDRYRESIAGRDRQFADISSDAARRAGELAPAGGGGQLAEMQAGVLANRQIADLRRQDADKLAGLVQDELAGRSSLWGQQAGLTQAEIDNLNRLGMAGIQDARQLGVAGIGDFTQMTGQEISDAINLGREGIGDAQQMGAQSIGDATNLGREGIQAQRQEQMQRLEMGLTQLQHMLKQAEAAKDRALKLEIQRMIQETQLQIAGMEFDTSPDLGDGVDSDGNGISDADEEAAWQSGVTPNQMGTPDEVGIKDVLTGVPEGATVFTNPITGSGAFYDEGSDSFYVEGDDGFWYKVENEGDILDLRDAMNNESADARDEEINEEGYIQDEDIQHVGQGTPSGDAAPDGAVGASGDYWQDPETGVWYKNINGVWERTTDEWTQTQDQQAAAEDRAKQLDQYAEDYWGQFDNASGSAGTIEGDPPEHWVDTGNGTMMDPDTGQEFQLIDGQWWPV